MVKEKKSL